MRCESSALRLGGTAFMVLLTAGSLGASSLFQPVQTYRSPGFGAAGATSIVVADVNGDRKPDVVVATLCGITNCNGTIGILLGNGDGTIQPVQSIDLGPVFTSSVAVADFNGDGKLDLAATVGGFCTPDCNFVNVLLGNGDGTFGAPQAYPSGGVQTRSVAVADVNGDGNPDMLVANYCSDSSCGGDGVIELLLGNGDGTFRAGGALDSGSGRLWSAEVADVNGDGKPDVFVAHELGVLGVLLGNGDGTFQAPQTYFSGGYETGSILAADVNGDNKPDLVAISACPVSAECIHGLVSVLLGNGDGTFQAAATYDSGAFQATSIASGDVNGDGKLDLLVSHHCHAYCTSSPVTRLLGNGDGTFQKALRYGSGGKDGFSITVADVSGDHKPDILVANACVSPSDCGTGSVGVLLGTSGVQTTTSVVSNMDHAMYGQPLTLTATVISVGTKTPTGIVRFQSGTTVLGMATLSGGVAVLSKPHLPAGAWSVIATYNGDEDSAKSMSLPLSLIVEKAKTATTALSSLNPSVQGQAVTFTAVVTCPTARVEAGTVTFTAGSATLGTITLKGRRATFTTSLLPKGNNQKITATFSGTANILGSAGSLRQSVI